MVYPGDSPPRIQRITDLQQGDSLTASTVTIGCHVGTHVDAPAHFLAHGKFVGELPLESFYGSALVINQQGKQSIEKTDLVRLSIPKRHHIFFKTDNGSLLHEKTFSANSCIVSKEAAKFLCQFSPLSIGWDYYSLDPRTSPEFYPAHSVLALANIPVFVCLNLVDIKEGPYWFSGFPLRLEGVEGAQVRAILSHIEE